MDDLERAVGRLEGEIKRGFEDLGDRIDRISEGVFGKEGLECRMRDVEGDLREIKTGAGIVAAAISLAVAGGIWLIKVFFHRD